MGGERIQGGAIEVVAFLQGRGHVGEVFRQCGQFIGRLRLAGPLGGAGDRRNGCIKQMKGLHESEADDDPQHENAGRPPKAR